MHFCADEAMALVMFLTWFPGIRWIRMWWAKRSSAPKGVEEHHHG
jgi:hypothetical protein